MKYADMYIHAIQKTKNEKCILTDTTSDEKSHRKEKEKQARIILPTNPAYITKCVISVKRNPM